MTWGQARCLSHDSLRAAYWEAWQAGDRDATHILRCEMHFRRILP